MKLQWLLKNFFTINSYKTKPCTLFSMMFAGIAAASQPFVEYTFLSYFDKT